MKTKLSIMQGALFTQGQGKMGSILWISPGLTFP